MRIGLNLLYLLPSLVGGVETYATGLLRGLAKLSQQDEFIIFVNKESERWPIPEARNFKRVICPVYATSRWQRYLFEQTRLPQLLKTYEVEVVHS